MAILTFAFRMRWAILTLLVLGAAAGGYAGLRDAVPPADALLAGTASVVLVLCVGYVHVRHVGLAVIMALAPLLGMVAAALAARGLTTGALLAIYGLGGIAAALAGGETVRRVLVEGAGGDAAKLSLARLFVPAMLAVLAAAAVSAAWLFRGDPALTLRTACVLLASVVFAVLGATFGASVLPFTEGFFTTANRVRERREHLLRLTTGIVQSRWALSIAGIALVLAVLGWFGIAPFLVRSAWIAKPALWSASALGVFLIAFAAGRDWREALAATAALAVFVLLVLWLRCLTAGRLSPPALIEIVTAAGAAYLPMLALATGRRRFHAAGDESTVARLRALEDLGASPYFAAVAAAAALAPWTVLHGSVAVLAGAFLLAGGTAVVVQPAIATALEWFIPHRRSLSQLYGRG
ncbi:MAG: hypothetical protein WDM81_20095 [Rhizomicrobium sp.]